MGRGKRRGEEKGEGLRGSTTKGGEDEDLKKHLDVTGSDSDQRLYRIGKIRTTASAE